MRWPSDGLSELHHETGEDKRKRDGYRRAILWPLGLSILLLLVEVTAAFLTNSLALFSDAGHLFTDVGAMLLALFAMWMAELPPTPGKTFGYYRMEIFAALLNAVTLLLIALYIFHEAHRRLASPQEVYAPGIIAVAVLGLAVNLTGLLVLHDKHRRNLNLHGVFLHVLGDALGSLGTLAAGIIMALTRWYYADPIISLVIAAVIVVGAFRLLYHAVNVLLEGVPHGISIAEILDAIRGLPGVVEVHDLHVWTLTSGVESLSTHVLVADYARGEQIVQAIHLLLRERFRIEHVTVQIEQRQLDERHIH